MSKHNLNCCLSDSPIWPQHTEPVLSQRQSANIWGIGHMTTGQSLKLPFCKGKPAFPEAAMMGWGGGGTLAPLYPLREVISSPGLIPPHFTNPILADCCRISSSSLQH